MKRKIFILSVVILLLPLTNAKANFPVYLGGFKLGGEISKYENKINIKSCRPIPLNNYLIEGEIIPPPGIKSGIIVFGACDRPDKILKIKFKFKDDSKKFYNTLLAKYKNVFGEPDTYKGDPFMMMRVWKWAFQNKNNESISLVLQYNKRVEGEKKGTAVKMTLTSQVEKERSCFLKQHPETKTSVKNNDLTGKPDWNLFIPHE